MNNTLRYLIITLIVFAIAQAPAISQKKAKQAKSSKAAYIFEINGKKYTYDDINAAYKRNNPNKKSELKDLSQDSVKSFVDMFVAYRLKIEDALSKGYDKDEETIKELSKNKRLVADSYMNEKLLVAPFVQKELERRNKEMQISYIIFLANHNIENDTVIAYEKATEVLEKLRKGESFAELARRYSDDSSTAVNGGLVDMYATACKLDRVIEDPLYTLKSGEFYNDIIKVPQFGYMIIKANEVQDRKLIRFKHLLLNYEKDEQGGDFAKRKIDSLYYLIKNEPGMFEPLASLHSADDASAQNGGHFKEYYSRATGFESSAGRYLDKGFENIIYKLKDGELSEPVATQYGYHIIQRIDSRPPNKDIESKELSDIYRRSYLKEDKAKLLQQYKEKFGYKLYKENFDRLIASLDTNKTNLDSLWDSRIPLDLMNKPLYTYSKDEVKIKDLVQKMKQPGRLRGLPTNTEGINIAIAYLTDDITLDLVADELSKNNQEYSDLIDNFRDGTLLFKVESQEVWNKLHFDSTMARQYYEANKEKYQTNLAYDVQELYMINKGDIDEVYKKLKNKEISFDDAVANHTQRRGQRETFGYFGNVQVGKFKIADYAKQLNIKEGEFCEPIQVENGYSIIKVKKIYPPRTKTYEEAMDIVAPIVQTQVQKSLLDNWIKSLKTKFNYKLNTAELNKISK